MRRHIFWLALCLVLIWGVGCDNHDSKTSTSSSKIKMTPGESLYLSLEKYVEKTPNGSRKVATLRSPSQLAEIPATHKEKIQDAANMIFEGAAEVSRSASREDAQMKVFQALLEMIEDNTLPHLTDAIGALLREMSQDDKAMTAVQDFINSQSGANFKSLVAVLRKAMAYPENEKLFLVLGRLMRENPEILRNVLELLSQGLSRLPEDENSEEGKAILELFAALCQEVPGNASEAGMPSWIARLDANGNPMVRKDQHGKLFFPFVDDGHGVCKVNADKMPIDASGQLLKIPAIGSQPYKDAKGQVIFWRGSDRRAMSGNEPVFEYYDAKKTVLGTLLMAAGQAVRDDLLDDAARLLKTGFSPKKPYSDELGSYHGFSDDTHLAKAALGAIEMLYGTGLFKMSAEFKPQLDQAQASEELVAKFASSGQTLWPSPTVKILTKGSAWAIVNEDHSKEYIVLAEVKNGAEELGVYSRRDIGLLLKGFSFLFENHPKVARDFLVGFAKMLFMLRDSELMAPEQMMFAMMQIIMQKKVPELFNALSEMSKPHMKIPGTEINLYMHFNMWLGQNIERLTKRCTWHLRFALKDLEKEHPGLTENFCMKAFQLVCSDWVAPIVPSVIDGLVNGLRKSPQAIGASQEGLKALIKSRLLAFFIDIWEKLVASEGVLVVKDAVVNLLTPQAEESKDVCGELARAGVGMLSVRNTLGVKVRMLKTVGEFLNPQRPIVGNLVIALSRLLHVDQTGVCLRLVRSLVNVTEKYDLAPVIIFCHAGIEVMRVDSGRVGSSVFSRAEIDSIFGMMTSFLLHENDLLQSFYRTIRERAKK